MIIMQYLNWAFRSSFTAVILSATAAFFMLTILFALVIIGMGMRRPDCIYVNGEDFSKGGAFLDAYALSWTTFSTVVSGCTLVLRYCFVEFWIIHSENLKLVFASH